MEPAVAFDHQYIYARGGGGGAGSGGTGWRAACRLDPSPLPSRSATVFVLSKPLAPTDRRSYTSPPPRRVRAHHTPLPVGRGAGVVLAALAVRALSLKPLTRKLVCDEWGES